MLTLGYSRIKSFKRCRRQFYLSYVKDYGRPAGSDNNALLLGKAVHWGLEQSYKGIVSTDEELYQAMEEQCHSAGLDDYNTTLACEMAVGYVHKWLIDDLARYSIVGVELPFQITLPSGNVFQGVIDGVFKDEHGHYWIHEIKTMSRVGPDVTKAIHLDDQIRMYSWAFWKAFGEMPVGALYSVLRKAIPAKPARKSAGVGLSVDRSQKCTVRTYAQAILKHGYKIEDYAEVLNYLATDPHLFFPREQVLISAGDIKRIDGQIERIEAEMVEALKYDAATFYPSPTEPWAGSCICSFKDICIDYGNDFSESFEPREEHFPEGSDAINKLTRITANWNVSGDVNEG